MGSTDREEEESQRIVTPPPDTTTSFEEKRNEKEGNDNVNADVEESAKSSSSSSYSTTSLTSIAGEIQRTVLESKDSAIRSVTSLHHSSSSHLRSFHDFLPQLKSEFRAYEDTFFSHLKDEVMTAKEHPAAAIGLGLAASFLLMRGPRRFLFRHTLGRFQSEEAQFVKAENNVKELNLSVGLMKKESRKLLERTALAEKEMKQGHDELMNAGGSIQRLAKSMYKVESQAAELMDGLREIPGREPLRLRAEVASMASALKRHRVLLDKRIMKISELGVSV